MNIVLWILQILLALVFLFSGGMKFVMTLEDIRKQSPPGSIEFSMAFLKFIGVCEILGGLGLVLPGLTKIKRFLTPLAAVGLLIIMIGAVATSLMGPGLKYGVIPLVCGVLCAIVAYGRRNWM
jgi:uncharacterized membrane protein YphA (DoxX/SURF4 family)